MRCDNPLQLRDRQVSRGGRDDPPQHHHCRVISELTVKSHIGRIFVKLDLRDRAAAIVYAYDHGLVTPRYPT